MLSTKNVFLFMSFTVKYYFRLHPKNNKLEINRRIWMNSTVADENFLPDKGFGFKPKVLRD